MRVGSTVIPIVAGVLLTVAACTSSSHTTSPPPATVSTTVTATASTAPVTTPTVPPTGPASSAAPASGGSTGSGPGLCTPTVMTFRLGSGNGAGGTDSVPVVATNASRQPCVTTGYPGVAALDTSGRQIAQADRGSEGQQVSTLVVQPGQQISALLTGHVEGPGGECPESAAILFTLPDNTDSTRIVTALPACPGGFGVQPFVRGTTGLTG